MKRWLIFSLMLNALLVGLFVWCVQLLGGFGYTWHRLQHREWGVYHHRAQHFTKLPAASGAIVFLGDSQVQQAEWPEMFETSKVVLNRGISGDYTAGVLARIAEVLRHKPAQVFLLIGINDLFFGKKTSEISADYQKIVQRIRSESPDTELYVLSVAPVNNKVREVGIKNAAIEALNREIRQIAQGYALPYIDIATLLSDADGNLGARFTDDGLHLNGLGYLIIKNELKKYIENGREGQ